ncbi:response regulator [Arthrobacter sp. Br18]|uniref:response regulator n=1 Tax=Arthrobacter sp. Br18 TaxID=1312954 RepID=UPI0004B1203F|nr:response regulator [Arthrobacter sp. Br18]
MSSDPAQIRAVVVDDDHEVAGVHTGFLLAHGGFDVVGVAHTGARALELVATLRPQLVLLDIHLPDITGIEVLRAIRNLAGDPTDVVAITAARELDTVRAAVAGGVLHYLVKPFSSSVLNQRLDQYVAYRRALEGHGSTGAGALDQSRIDEILRPTPGSAVVASNRPAGVDGSPRPADFFGSSTPAGAAAPTPKGLSAPTLQAVSTDLQAHPAGTSASEVAARVGLARVSARRYLEYLVTRGQARIVPQYGSAGRPEKHYVWTARGAAHASEGWPTRSPSTPR